MSDTTKPSGLGALAQAVILKNAFIEMKKAELEQLQAEYEQLQEAVTGALVQEGLASIKYRDWTIFLHTSTHASLKNTEGDEDPKQAARDALRKNKLEWMIREHVFVQTLESWVREQPVDEHTMAPVIPDALKPFINVFQKTDLRVRKS